MSFDASQYLRNYPELKPAFKDHSVLSAYDDPLEAAAAHYELYGKNEGRTSAAPDYNTGVEGAQTGDNTSGDFDLDKFEGLLNRLEASKKRQQRQKSVEGRRDTFAKGLSGMMSNF